MLKYGVVCVSIALLISCSALGAINQGQTVAIGTGNTVHLLQSDQNSHWSQNLTVNLTQEGEGGTGLISTTAFVSSPGSSIGSALGAASLLGATHLHSTTMLGAGSLLMPSATSANALLARARLNSLLLRAN